MPRSILSRPGRQWLVSLASAILCLGNLPTDARAQATGRLDPGFDPGSGFDITDTGTIAQPPHQVNAVALQPDGKVLVGGNFTSYNGAPLGALVRLDADGSADATFNANLVVPSGGINLATYNVSSLALQPDGKVLAVEESTGIFDDALQTFTSLARLNSDGTPDTGFKAAVSSHGGLLVAVQADGKIVVVTPSVILLGRHVYPTYLNIISRLNPDGSQDAAFASRTVTDTAISSLAVQADGKIIIGGSFERADGARRRRLARLNADGTLDTTFQPGVTSPGTKDDVSVSSLAVQTDGKIIIGGSFTTVDGVLRGGLARLDADGTLDADFHPGVGREFQAVGTVSSLAVQTDGKIIIGGFFKRIEGAKRHRLARLRANGHLGKGFNPGPGPDGGIEAMAVQPDGKIIIGGSFMNYGGVPRAGIARVE